MIDAAIHSVVHELMTYVAVACGTFLAAAAAAATRYFLRLTKVTNTQIEAQVYGKTQQIVRDIVLSVEEDVEAWVKRGMKLATSKSREKLERAMKRILDQFPTMSNAEARERINAALVETGLGASAPTVPAVIAAPATAFPGH